jgi:2'-5' RNA ligase
MQRAANRCPEFMEDRGAKMDDGESSAGTLRLFVAISLPDSVKDRLEEAQRHLRQGLRGNFVRWTKRGQFHLTLRFLGNVAESQVVELIAALREACLNYSVLKLHAEQIGFFPQKRFPRVVWVGVHDEKGALSRLQSLVEAAVQKFTGERPEKRFTGHVTLGRIQRIKRPDVEALVHLASGMSEHCFGDWMADKVELICSEFSSSGSRYTTLADIPLS